MSFSLSGRVLSFGEGCIHLFQMMLVSFFPSLFSSRVFFEESGEGILRWWNDDDRRERRIINKTIQKSSEKEENTFISHPPPHVCFCEPIP